MHVVDQPPLDERWTDTAEPRRGRVAVLVCHGMGQQVRFETQDLVARLLAHAAGGVTGPVITRLVTLPGGTIAGRAELTLSAPDGPRDVHVYEAYWAPFTEGAVRLRDVAAFLLRAGAAGIRHSAAGCFRRFLFNGWRTFTIPASDWAAYVFAVLLLASFAVLNAAIGVGAIAAVIGPLRGWPPPFAMANWTVDLLLAVVPGGVLALALFGLSAHERRRRTAAVASSRTPAFRTIAAVTRMLLWTTLASIVASAAAIVWHATGGAGWPLAVDLARSRGGHLFMIAVWIVVLLLSAAVRWTLVQYVGDVAAYVSGPWLDRFYVLRGRIREACGTIGRAVYANRTYERVIVAGHSLGSVVAYDVLNALINDDLTAASSDARPRDVVGRTPLFLTFGSPLDKTAFVFRTARAAGHDVREALAAAVQPMIVDADWRPARWVNIWSPRGWVSGSLDFYDDPAGGGGARRIVNLRDADADVPLVAHVQYWTGALVAECLLRAITEPSGADMQPLASVSRKNR
jgi:hypothetical protein